MFKIRMRKGTRVNRREALALAVGALAASLLLCAWVASAARPASAAAPFVVNSNGDQPDVSPGDGTCAVATTGKCTLRAAIDEANRRSGADDISFAIPGTGPHTITLGSALPAVSDASGPTAIDGYTQPGASANTDPSASNAVIQVQVTAPAGASGRDGLLVTSSGNAVRGLAFYGLRKPIWLYGPNATNNTVAGNFVGTNAAGTYAAGTKFSGADGVSLQAGARENTVGGTSAADRNVVSGNAFRGVAFFGETTRLNRVVNNIVGLGPRGDKRLANLAHGIDLNVGASQNHVGGTGSGERNVVSGNGDNGVEVSHEPTTAGNRVSGNFIGTDLAGRTAPSYARNGNYGVQVEDRVANNEVAENVIGNNGKGGVRIASLSTGTVVRDNRIGVSLDGGSIPNASYGVQIEQGASGSRIGPGNTIANNGINGVLVADDASDRNTITRNSIYNNKALGINLDLQASPTLNDPGDADSGPNEQLNFPDFERTTPQEVTGTACASCIVEVYLADGGSSAYGEGKTLAGSATAGTDGKFTVPVSGVAAGGYVTATATDSSGNTSEFSPNKVISNDTTAPAAPTGLTATASAGGVALDWSDNAEPDLRGYSVYRSTTRGGPYAKLTSAPLSSSSYTDTGAVHGDTYYYVVTATDRSGNESGYGNEVSAVVGSRALLFDGTDDRVTIPSSSLLNMSGTAQRTYEMRIKTGADVNARQFAYEEGGGKGNGFSVEIQGGRLYFNAWSLGVSGWDTVSASAAVSPNTTYHVAGVYHQPSGEVRLYLDGVLKETSTGAGMMRSHSEGGVLGGITGSARDHARNSVTSGSHFGGLIDEFRVWKQALTQTRIESGMRSDLTGGETGLIVLYEIEEGSGTVLDDASPNNLNGTINGATWTTTD